MKDQIKVSKALRKFQTFVKLQLVIYLVVCLSFSNTTQAQDLKRYTFSEPKMGTTFRIVFYTTDDSTANLAARAAFNRVDELNLIFSDYQENSEVSKLSQSAGEGEKVKSSPELWKVLRFSKKLSKKSKGAFDVSIGPLSKLWRRAFRQQEFPASNKIIEALNLVGFKYIKLYKKGHKVSLKKSNMRLDFGGIAKGYTVDEVYQVLQERGISRALVDGGGDIFAGDPPPGQSAWEIEWLVDSGPTSELKKNKLFLVNRAVASSGSTYKFLNWDGQKYSHIIDPRTGLGITKTTIINVLADNCMQADAMASALSVSNDRERIKLLRAYRNVTLLN